MTPSRPRRAWLLAGVVVAVLGAGGLGSVAVADARAEAVLERERNDFERAAADLTASLTTSLRRNADVMASAAAYLAASEHVTNPEFRTWFDSAAAGRYPGLLAFAFVERVPGDRLDAFLAAQRLDPSPMATGSFEVVPPGARAEYCFIRLGVAMSDDMPLTIPGGVDVCAIDPAMSAGLRHAAAERELTLFPLVTSAEALGEDLSLEARRVRGTTFIQSLPVHSASGDLQGWVVAPFDGPTIVESVLAGRDDITMRVRSNAGTGELVIAEHRADGRGEVLVGERTFDADGSWTVELTQYADAAHARAAREERLVLAIGFVVTVLLAALLAALLWARDHALRLVDHKTDELRHQALHDALTGLPNRVLVLDRAEQLLARGRREGRTPVAMFVDVDRFKTINDTLGHAAGDTVLRAVADRIRSVVRGADTVGRLGGDEFVVLADGSALGGTPEALAERLLEVMAEPVDIDTGADRTVVVGVSIGVAVGDRASADDLLRDADVALYRAKQSGRSCYVRFDDAMQSALRERLQLELDLYRAVDDGQLHLVYQPTVALDDGAVTGVEALLRWHHPSFGIVAPATFIPLAEENGTIVRIGEWVLDEACRQGAAWHAAGHPVSVAVNVSVRQLETEGIVATVEAALARSGLPATSLVLEVTESALIADPEAIAGRLAQLKALGARIAIDDFGTGYSSLGYLQRFEVDTLKIDRSFVARMTESPESHALVHTLVRLGKTLGIETFAEGIEDVDQLQQLRDERCDGGQGYLFARPLEVDDLTAFLASHPVRTPVA